MYEEAREYHNVLPSEPAAAHADAGKITFAEAARIDTTKAVGYKAASTYCVAPILDPSSNNRVESPPHSPYSCSDFFIIVRATTCVGAFTRRRILTARSK